MKRRKHHIHRPVLLCSMCSVDVTAWRLFVEVRPEWPAMPLRFRVCDKCYHADLSRWSDPNAYALEFRKAPRDGQ